MCGQNSRIVLIFDTCNPCAFGRRSMQRNRTRSIEPTLTELQLLFPHPLLSPSSLSLSLCALFLIHALLLTFSIVPQKLTTPTLYYTHRLLLPPYVPIRVCTLPHLSVFLVFPSPAEIEPTDSRPRTFPDRTFIITF